MICSSPAYSRKNRSVPKELRKGLNSLIILVAWDLWKHRNACVFEWAGPNVQVVLQIVANGSRLWCMACASALHELLIRSLTPDSL
ncbi:hypothetical protein SETIT_1G144200v2 [Setaria italica]|nr:hypothetical protein SETIT_1G144200v2 [Setaria italica]